MAAMFPVDCVALVTFLQTINAVDCVAAVTAIVLLLTIETFRCRLAARLHNIKIVYEPFVAYKPRYHYSIRFATRRMQPYPDVTNDLYFPLLQAEHRCPGLLDAFREVADAMSELEVPDDELEDEVSDDELEELPAASGVRNELDFVPNE
jgi:hypothetical protein